MSIDLQRAAEYNARQLEAGNLTDEHLLALAKALGFHGARLAEAVAEFQRRRGLRADGMAGPRTRAELTRPPDEYAELIASGFDCHILPRLPDGREPLITQNYHRHMKRRYVLIRGKKYAVDGMYEERPGEKSDSGYSSPAGVPVHSPAEFKLRSWKRQSNGWRVHLKFVRWPNWLLKIFHLEEPRAVKRGSLFIPGIQIAVLADVDPPHFHVELHKIGGPKRGLYDVEPLFRPGLPTPEYEAGIE